MRSEEMSINTIVFSIMRLKNSKGKRSRKQLKERCRTQDQEQGDFAPKNREAPKKKSNPVGIRALTKPESYGIISFLAVTG